MPVRNAWVGQGVLPPATVVDQSDERQALMPDAVTVVALIHVVPGKVRDQLEAFREVSPLVHREQGCELYAAHVAEDGETVVMIERWSSRADLEAHLAGAAIARLSELSSGLRSAPTDMYLLDPVPLGDDGKGSLPF